MTTATKRTAIIPLTKDSYIGVLNTKDGRKLYTPKGTKSEVILAFARMPEYKMKPELITLQ